jgi:hypothetical protein
MSVREAGLAIDETLARELGLLMSDSGPRLGRGPGPKESLLIPEVLSLGTWLLPDTDELKFVGVVSSPATDEAVDPAVRFLERTVTVDGTIAPLRGEARGGVWVGAGSLERAECTLASSRCIWAVRVRMCERELEAGILCRVLVDRFAGVRSGTPPVEGRPLGKRVPEAAGLDPLGLGVISEDRRGFLLAPAAGVLPDCDVESALLDRADASDAEGDGGSCSLEALPATDTPFDSGGVVMSGELAVE